MNVIDGGLGAATATAVAADQEAPLIEVRHLKKYFGSGARPVRAVDDVSFEIRRGETLGLVDRAYILHDGRVLMSGTAAEVVRDEAVRRVYLGQGFGQSLGTPTEAARPAGLGLVGGRRAP